MRLLKAIINNCNNNPFTSYTLLPNFVNIHSFPIRRILLKVERVIQSNNVGGGGGTVVGQESSPPTNVPEVQFLDQYFICGLNKNFVVGSCPSAPRAFPSQN